jgi:hypothetical protein
MFKKLVGETPYQQARRALITSTVFLVIAAILLAVSFATVTANKSLLEENQQLLLDNAVRIERAAEINMCILIKTVPGERSEQTVLDCLEENFFDLEELFAGQ